jgi:hypothetical protein
VLERELEPAVQFAYAPEEVVHRSRTALGVTRGVTPGVSELGRRP